MSGDNNLDATVILPQTKQNMNQAMTREAQENARVLKAGTILDGKYDIERVLGEGGFGITYLGLDKFLNVKVAIKEYFPAQFATRNTLEGTSNNLHVISGERTELFEKGLKSYEYEANRLSHFSALPGIVSVLNFFYENNTAYMVMEYIEGITLKEYLRLHNEKIGWQETLKMMEPVIQSFEYIHDAGIIHRDISPDNIMVSPDETITIIDFGSARGFEDDSKSKTIVLKHGYAPPEQYYKNGQQGTWTDVYSLCATIYRMITGTKLPESLAIKSKDASIIPLRKFDKNIPSDIEAAVIRGLSVDIAERISNMKDLKEYLYKGRKVRTSKAQKRFFVKLFGGIILITAAVGILVPLIWNVSSQSRESDLVDVTDVSDDVENSGSDTTLENFQDEDQENQEEMIDTDYTDIGDLTYINSGNSITITGADYTVTDVIIPPEIENLPVKAITGMGSNVTSIVIPEGVEIIGENAFRNCVYLESVSIPSTVSVIQDGAFSNCRSLNNILIDEDNLYFYNQGGQVYEKE